ALGAELIDVVGNVAVGGDDIFPAVVVQIGERYSPAASSGGGDSAFRWIRDVDESGACVAEEGKRLAGERGDQDIGAAVVVVVVAGTADAPFFVANGDGLEAAFYIAVEQVFSRAGDEEIDPAIAVKVRGGGTDGESFAS